MKKIFSYSPIIFAVFIIVIVIGLLSLGVFDAPKKTTITSYTLREIVNTSKLTTAKYIQNGIADAYIEGKGEHHILYYAYARPNIDLSKIEYYVDNEKKAVTVTIPDKFTYDIELLSNDEYKCYYYPQNSDALTDKSAQFICEEDARNEIKKNQELNKKATESLKKAIIALLTPLLDSYNYSIEFAN